MDFFHRPEDPLNQPGFWGQRTSAVDWCESNYTWTYYIAEFFNTITSLPAAFLALYGMYLTYKYGYDKRFYIVNLMVGMVGLGSAAFHGTLLYTGQILDELPMVYASIAFLYTVLEMESTTKPKHKYLAPILIAFSVVFTGVYLCLPDFFIFFLIAYICAILTLVYQCSLIYRKPSTVFHQKVLVILGVSSYIGGFLFFWVPEILYCDTLKAFNFHSWWHVTSTIGGFIMVIFSTFQREYHRGRNPKLNYNCFMGVPILPYIHIPSEKEIAILNRKSKEDISSAIEDSPMTQQRNKKSSKKSSMSSFR